MWNCKKWKMKNDIIKVSASLKISKKGVGFILLEHFSMRNENEYWVCSQRGVWGCSGKNRTDFSCRYVKMFQFETYHYTPKSNRQPIEWTTAGVPRPKCKNATVSLQDSDVRILGDAIFFHRIFWQSSDNQQRPLHGPTHAFEGENRNITVF